MKQLQTEIFLFIPLALITMMLFVSSTGDAYAQNGNLFISPQRMELDKKKKTSQLHLVNKSDEVKTYEISMKNYAMNDKGSLGKEVEAMPFSSKKFIRFSPRRVTLQPGEDQYVRVMLRAPKDLEDGGYHSHIEFSEAENANNKSNEQKDGAKGAQVSFKVGAAYGVAIPVFVNIGETNGSLSLDGIKAEVNKGENTGKAVVTLKRAGNTSTQKKLTLYYVDSSGEEHLVTTPTHVSVYREVDHINREFHLRLPEDKKFASGNLKASLSEINENTVLDEETVSIQ